MSLEWKYATVPLRCHGRAHSTEQPRMIAKGELYLEITINAGDLVDGKFVYAVTKPRIRCLDCTGNPQTGAADRHNDVERDVETLGREMDELRTR